MIRSIGTVVRAAFDQLVVDVPEWPGHTPGQFAMLQLSPEGRRSDPLLPRPMALFRSRLCARGAELEFRFKVLGRGTRVLSQLRAGDPLGIVGPLGNGFAPPSATRTWLVGGGTGIASLYELARDARAPVVVLLGGRSKLDLLALAEFEALGVELRVTTEDGSHGTRGRVTELLAPTRGEAVYACGPHGMMAAAAALARAAGARCAVSLENPMACGFGVCLGCAVQTLGGFRYVCTHGPVFDPETLGWGARE